MGMLIGYPHRSEKPRLSASDACRSVQGGGRASLAASEPVRAHAVVGDPAPAVAVGVDPPALPRPRTPVDRDRRWIRAGADTNGASLPHRSFSHPQDSEPGGAILGAGAQDAADEHRLGPPQLLPVGRRNARRRGRGCAQRDKRSRSGDGGEEKAWSHDDTTQRGPPRHTVGSGTVPPAATRRRLGSGRRRSQRGPG